MTIGEMFVCVKEFLKDLSWILVILGVFFEIVPIKIHPIQWLIKLIFKPIRNDIEDMNKKIINIDSKIDGVKTDINILKTEVSELKTEVTDHEDKIKELLASADRDSIARIRWEILQFANALENDQKHTRDSFLLCRDQYRRYHELLERNGMENGKLDAEMKKIDMYYEEHKDSNSFYI